MTLRERLAAIVAPLPPGASVTLPVDALHVWLEDEPAPEQPASSPATDRLIGPGDVAARLGVSRRAVYRRASGWPFTRRVGRSLRFSAAGLERWLARAR
jgi:predicted DNA-binding transcriptional regulator AlpA